MCTCTSHDIYIGRSIPDCLETPPLFNCFVSGAHIDPCAGDPPSCTITHNCNINSAEHAHSTGAVLSVRSCIDNFTCPKYINFETIIKLMLHLKEEAEKGICGLLLRAWPCTRLDVRTYVTVHVECLPSRVWVPTTLIPLD